MSGEEFVIDPPRFEVSPVTAPNVTVVRISAAATVENRHADTFRLACGNKSENNRDMRGLQPPPGRYREYPR